MGDAKCKAVDGDSGRRCEMIAGHSFPHQWGPRPWAPADTDAHATRARELCGCVACANVIGGSDGYDDGPCVNAQDIATALRAAHAAGAREMDAEWVAMLHVWRAELAGLVRGDTFGDAAAQSMMRTLDGFAKSMGVVLP